MRVRGCLELWSLNCADYKIKRSSADNTACPKDTNSRIQPNLQKERVRTNEHMQQAGSQVKLRSDFFPKEVSLTECT